MYFIRRTVDMELLKAGSGNRGFMAALNIEWEGTDKFFSVG